MNRTELRTKPRLRDDGAQTKSEFLFLPFGFAPTYSPIHRHTHTQAHSLSFPIFPLISFVLYNKSNTVTHSISYTPFRLCSILLSIDSPSEPLHPILVHPPAVVRVFFVVSLLALPQLLPAVLPLQVLLLLLQTVDVLSASLAMPRFRFFFFLVRMECTSRNNTRSARSGTVS